MFGSKNRCPKCKKRVFAFESVSIEGDSYHHACVTCKTCKSRLDDKSYRLLDGDFYCHKHYFALRPKSPNSKSLSKSTNSSGSDDANKSEKSGKSKTKRGGSPMKFWLKHSQKEPTEKSTSSKTDSTDSGSENTRQQQQHASKNRSDSPSSPRSKSSATSSSQGKNGSEREVSRSTTSQSRSRSREDDESEEVHIQKDDVQKISSAKNKSPSLTQKKKQTIETDDVPSSVVESEEAFEGKNNETPSEELVVNGGDTDKEEIKDNPQEEPLVQISQSSSDSNGDSQIAEKKDELESLELEEEKEHGKDSSEFSRISVESDENGAPTLPVKPLIRRGSSLLQSRDNRDFRGDDYDASPQNSPVLTPDATPTHSPKIPHRQVLLSKEIPGLAVTASPSRRFRCRKCRKEFSTKGELVNHSFTLHVNDESEKHQKLSKKGHSRTLSTLDNLDEIREFSELKVADEKSKKKSKKDKKDKKKSKHRRAKSEFSRRDVDTDYRSYYDRMKKYKKKSSDRRNRTSHGEWVHGC